MMVIVDTWSGYMMVSTIPWDANRAVVFAHGGLPDHREGDVG